MLNPIRLTYEIPSAALIGFTDFAYEVAEGSKSEIFRRCDIGASNENQKSLQRILERLPFSGESSNSECLFFAP